MWLLNENSHTAETASLNPWALEQQQSRWGGAEMGNGYDEQMRSIIPPAFRNPNAKVIWQDSAKSLEANVNEALGLTNWQASANGQFPEQDSNGSGQYQPAGYMNGVSAGWGQTEIDQTRPWDVGATVTMPSQGTRNPSNPYANPMQQPKWPTNEEQSWAMQRPPTLPCPPPPNYLTPRNNPGWQQNGGGPRNGMYAPPTQRFTGPPMDGAGSWNGCQRMVPPSPMPPPQRSRLQNVWSNNAPTPTGMCMPPPTLDYPGAVPQWGAGPSMASTRGVSKPPQQTFNNLYPNRCSPPLGPFNSQPVANSNSFMGEDSMWQDPNGDVRKWQRDSGTGIWGDPEIQPTEIHRWLVPAGAEMESTLDQKTGDEPDPSGESKTDGSTANKPCRVIVPMGWGELRPPAVETAVKVVNPVNSSVPPNPNAAAIPWSSHVATALTSPQQNNGGGWGDGGRGVMKVSVSAPGWEGMAESQWSSHSLGGPSSPVGNSPDAGMPVATQLIADQLRTAVSKGLIDFSLLSKPLPHETLSLINTLLLRLPVLNQTEYELSSLLSNVKLSSGGEPALCGNTSPTALMNAEQRAEHDRLVIEIAATKTDIAAIREKIHASQEAANLKMPGVSGDALCAITPRFGDSILDAAAGVEPNKPLFSIF